MKNHTHTCPDCDSDYAGTGTTFESDDHGTLSCDCLRAGRCAECEPSCQRCAEEDGVYVAAVTGLCVKCEAVTRG